MKAAIILLAFVFAWGAVGAGYFFLPKIVAVMISVIVGVVSGAAAAVLFFINIKPTLPW